MKSYDEFKTFYKQELLDELKHLDKIRSKRIGYTVFAVIAMVIIFPVTCLLIFLTFWFSPMIWLIYFCLYLFVCSLLIKWIWTGFNSQFKYRVILKILHFINPTLEYFPKKHIGEYAFDQSSLFLSKYNKFNGEDLIKGTIGQTAMKCSELKVLYTSDDSTKTIFKGLFIVADFNKDFQGQTFVLPDRAEKFLGRIGQTLQSIGSRRGELIKLEDAEFEKEFVVYGTDQIESRYILTPALMRKILDLHKKNNTKTHLSFYQSKVYIAISLDRNLFEPNKGKQVDYLSACHLFQDLSMAIGIVDDLNLNTRIWTKE
ncbi:MAG: DUF3137 domain-containing protein [Planctomycetota bacterium]|jgi:hypothetical protein